MEPPSRPPHSYRVQRRIQMKAAGRGNFAATAMSQDDKVSRKRNRRLRRILATLIAVPTVLVALVALLLSDYSPFTVDVISRPEISRTSGLMSGYYGIVADPVKQRRLAELGDVRGAKFYEAAFKAKLLDPSLIGKLVCKNSTTDSTADKGWIDTAEPMPENSCSYTAPRADMLLEVLRMQGKQRCVVFCFNSRNWNNYPDHGVLVRWSDGDVAQYMTFDEARDDWGITEEEWADPAGKLFGIKAPFQHTYE